MRVKIFAKVLRKLRFMQQDIEIIFIFHGKRGIITPVNLVFIKIPELWKSIPASG